MFFYPFLCSNSYTNKIRFSSCFVKSKDHASNFAKITWVHARNACSFVWRLLFLWLLHASLLILTTRKNDVSENIVATVSFKIQWRILLSVVTDILCVLMLFSLILRGREINGDEWPAPLEKERLNQQKIIFNAWKVVWKGRSWYV